MLGGGVGRGGLKLLNPLHVLLYGGQTGNTDADDLQTPLLPPFLAENVVQGVRQLQGVHLQGAVADAHFGDLAEGHAQGGKQLAAQLAVQFLPGIVGGNVAADILIEEHGVADPVGEHAEAPQSHVRIQADVGIHHPEGHRAGGAVLVAGKLLGVEVVDSLILAGLPAEGYPAAEFHEGFLDPLAEVTAKDGGLGGSVVGVLAGLGGKFHDFSLIHDHHALTVGNQNYGAAGDDIVASLVVDGAAAAGLLPLHRQNVGGNGLTAEKFLPLIPQNAAGGIQTCTNKTHKSIILSMFCGL